MTIMRSVSTFCGVCGNRIPSVRARGGISRGTTIDGHRLVMAGPDPLRTEVRRCDRCGFRSPFPELPRGVTRDDLDDPVYRGMVRECSDHECAAYLLSRKGNHREAFRMYLHAAWLHGCSIRVDG